MGDRASSCSRFGYFAASLTTVGVASVAPQQELDCWAVATGNVGSGVVVGKTGCTIAVILCVAHGWRQGKIENGVNCKPSECRARE